MRNWFKEESCRYDFVKPWAVGVHPVPDEQLTPDEVRRERRLLADLAWEMLAQHYGIPTRLIDWSDSYHTALFFAYGGWSGDDIKKGNIPCVWCLDRKKLEDGGAKLGNAALGKKKSQARSYRDYLKSMPGAVRILHHNQLANPRQRAQRGWFSYVENLGAIDEHLRTHDGIFPVATLIKIPLDPEDQFDALDDLADAGTTVATIFNDLNGVSKDAINRFLRRIYALP